MPGASMLVLGLFFGGFWVLDVLDVFFFPGFGALGFWGLGFRVLGLGA